jgi:hypothetical protein
MQVEDHDFRTQPVVGGETGFAVQFARHFPAYALEVSANRAQHVGVVINQQDGISHQRLPSDG